VAVVVCLSPNPALDRVALVPGAATGGTHRAETYLDTAGGKGMHAAMVASALGADVEVVLPLGGWRGDRVAFLAAAEAIALRVVRIDGETRGTYTVVDPDAGALMEVLEPPPVLTVRDATALVAAGRAALADARVVVTTGSLPAGLPATWHADAVAARPAGCFAIVDASGAPLDAALAARPDLVKPNLAEAAALADVAVPTADPPELLVPVVIALRERGAANAWVSLGAQGSLLGTADGAVWLLPAPVLARPVNAVGCGDALAGGLAAGIASGLGVLAAALIGVAAAASKLTNLHPGRIDAVATRRLAASLEPRRLA
jgi:1-phosphofructokinase family hexose kinase